MSRCIVLAIILLMAASITTGCRMNYHPHLDRGYHSGHQRGDLHRAIKPIKERKNQHE